MNRQVVFISGPGRSGSTILQACLDGHPQLLVFPLEFNILYTYNNVLRESGPVTAGRFVDYLRKNTRLAHLGTVMPMPHSDPIDLSAMDAAAFWHEFTRAGDEPLSPADILDRMICGMEQAMGVDLGEKLFVLRANNLYLEPYRQAFPGCRFLYTARNPVDLYMGYMKYHTRTGLDWGSRKEYMRLTANVHNVVKISLSPALMGYDEQDTLRVRLEDIQRNRRPTMEAVAGFLKVNFDHCLEEFTIFGAPYSGNRVQKVSSAIPGVMALFRAQAYLSPSERDRIVDLLMSSDLDLYDCAAAIEKARMISRPLPSHFYVDLICSAFGQIFRRAERRPFAYLFPRDYELV